MEVTKQDYAKIKKCILASFPRKSRGQRMITIGSWLNTRHCHKMTMAECWKFYQDKGLSYERFRWDCLYGSRAADLPLYKYCKDQHIDTALRKIIKEVIG